MQKEQNQRNRRIEAYVILGLYFAAGCLLGYVTGKDRPKDANTVTVDIVKEGDEILIYEHYSKRLVLEYNKNKKADTIAYKEFDELWEESKN
ncbi:MAG: hypothetical protein Q8O13_10725 [Candidatus Omnitrophota bacterium]|nr:hypothetical protein [Candidatus Omnitrophota bacterium]